MLYVCRTMAGVYLHIPFCKQACHYCDFHFSTNTSYKAEMVKAIAREFELQKDYLSGPVETIYFGGGTPSLLTLAELNTLLSSIGRTFDVVDNPEITLEANPDDLSKGHLIALREAGVNRLSIGIQSFNDSVLKFMNRAHDSSMARTCLQDARDTGFNNVSIDLMYAVPGLSNAAWNEDLGLALEHQPEHISAYSMTIEERTVFGRWSQRGSLKPADEETSSVQFRMLIDILERNGYEHYEISNFAKPGFYSQHNTNYWRQVPYLGVGPAAHSFNLVTRQSNVANNHLYMKSLEKGIVPATVEPLTTEDKLNDYLLTTLRTKWGADLTKLREEFGHELLGQNQAYIAMLVEKGFAEISGDHLILTRAGKFLADKICSDLFVGSAA